jgi:glycosyltransferase involved in cell wall biosynthesis
MRFLYVADVSWWCLHRDGMGLVKYGNTGRDSWDIAHILEGECSAARFSEYDLVRFGALPTFYEAEKNNMLSGCKRVVLTFASWRDANFEVEVEAGTARKLAPPVHSPGKKKLRGIVINDYRMFPLATKYDVPVLYSPDKVDHEEFYSLPHLRPSGRVTSERPLRVGWAGSDRNWGGVKNLDILREAVGSTKYVELVLQRREEEGLKNAKEMREWINSLDVYCSVNSSHTCTPVTALEAACCGVPVLTTPCGDQWKTLREVQRPVPIVEEPSAEAVAEALRAVVSLDRPGLQRVGRNLSRFASSEFSWRSGEAKQVTRATEGMCRGV